MKALFQRFPSTLRRGMTLVEVMVAATILAFMAASLVSLFIQNSRFARAVTLRTVATTTAIGVAEQIRGYVYADFALRHENPTTSSLQVEVFDPTDSAAPNGMKVVNMPINRVDGTVATAGWTEVTVPFSLNETGTKSKIPMSMRFWLTSQIRQPTIQKDVNGKEVIATRCQIFEIALIYQWKNPNFSNTKWHSGVIRIVTPNLDMNVPDTPVKGS